MNCRIVGRGEPLVLIHGWGMNSNVWNNIEADLSKYFKLIMMRLVAVDQLTFAARRTIGPCFPL